MTALAWLAIACSVAPCILFLFNVRLYRKPPRGAGVSAVSVLIPARNEEKSIAAAIEAVLASRNVDLELIVLDDSSEDKTAEIVRRYGVKVKLLQGRPLPPGWCGKQFACKQLADAASHDVLCFVDADVKVSPNGIRDAVAFLEESGAALVSGFPHQETQTLFERALIPMMHFLLLGFLPVRRMRSSLGHEYAAGCGQFMVVDRDAYFSVGGHGAIAASRHDGIMLPKAFRKRGYATDLCDLTDAANCRMYSSASEVVSGLQKNAIEGLAAPGRILPITVLLLAGQVLPFVLFPRFPVLIAGVVAAYLPRFVAAIRFRQSMLGALLHPVAVLALLAIQWAAFARWLLRRPEAWKGRVYTAS